jgi:hypothetical protein
MSVAMGPFFLQASELKTSRSVRMIWHHTIHPLMVSGGSRGFQGFH